MRPTPDLAALAGRLPARPRTRFAPSPTGWLHLGHVVNAIYTWGIARAIGGAVLLRIEDHDRERSRPEYERAILDDLGWLGLQPDAGAPVPPGRHVRQSDREAVYMHALASLRERGLVYACSCSRKQIELVAGGDAGELRYPGTCRTRGLPWQPGTGLRLRLDAGAEHFDDVLMGRQVQEPAAQSGDLLIRDRIGQWTYQFAVAVDDTEQQVDLVIRGADLLPSTGRQIRLARLLGREVPPVFVHHALLYSESGVKLSKSNRDTGVRELRAQGLSGADVLGLAAAHAGLIDRPRPLAPDRLAALFGRASVLQEEA
jgi:glutamyl-tRNA synthetase/glutamyl-Q tRNA(Asp) synthetase